MAQIKAINAASSEVFVERLVNVVNRLASRKISPLFNACIKRLTSLNATGFWGQWDACKANVKSEIGRPLGPA